MLNCTVKIEFAAAKRLVGYQGKCGFLHGYRHAVEASFVGVKAANGIAVDFYEIKNRLQKWLEQNWDHNVLLSSKDEKLGAAIEKITGQKIFYFPENPTAENMAEYLFKKICPKLIKGAKCVKLRVYDSPDAWVEIG